MPAEITPEAADAGARTGELTLVDVRETEERDEVAPAVASLCLPIEQLPARLDELPRDRPIAFVCRSGGRSALATELAVSVGLDARNVVGGMLAWATAGLPTAGSAAPPPSR